MLAMGDRAEIAAQHDANPLIISMSISRSPIYKCKCMHAREADVATENADATRPPPCVRKMFVREKWKGWFPDSKYSHVIDFHEHTSNVNVSNLGGVSVSKRKRGESLTGPNRTISSGHLLKSA